MFTRSISQQNIFGTGNALTAAINTSTVNRTISLDVHRAVLDRRRRLAHARGLPEQRRPVVAADRAVLRRRPSAAAVGFGVPITETDTINFGFRLEHTDLYAVREQPADYFQFVTEFGIDHQQLHRQRRLVA